MVDELKRELIELGMEKSVRRSRKYKCGAWWDFDGIYRKYGHGTECIHHFHNLLDKFILKNVGRPYNKVFGEFCAKWPVIICGDINTRQEFRDKFIPRWRNDNQYIVDEHGLIQKNPDNRYNKIHKEKYKFVGYNGDVEYHYEFNKKLFNYPDIVEYFYDTIGFYNTLDLKKEDYIPNKIMNILLSKGYDWKEVIMNHKGYRICGNWIYEQKIYYNDPVYLEKGTKEYNQYFAESKKNLKAKRRINKKEKEEYLSNLLHNIETERKVKELAKDIVDRDRLGFDEESFKGEFYHGQKRKKKK